MKIQINKNQAIIFFAVIISVLLGLFFQNCSGKMASFSPVNSSSDVGSPSGSSNNDSTNSGGGGGATGTTVVNCQTTQENVGGICVEKCIDSQERINGLCAEKCTTSQERYNGICIETCGANSERIEGTCTAKCTSSQERVNGICIAKCSGTEERINGFCTTRCLASEERINGVCTARCASTEERINGVCTTSCGADEERINGSCVAKCPATLPRGTNGQCGTITKGVPAFVNVYGIQNATACGGNESTVPLVSNANGIATYRLDRSPFSCMSPVDMPIEIKFNAADGRCISGCNYNVQYTDNYGGASARILPMLSTLQNENNAPGSIFASKNLYYVSAVPASDEIKCQVELRNSSVIHTGKIALKKVSRVMAAAGNGYGTTPTLYVSTGQDKSFHLFGIEWAPDVTYENKNMQYWDTISPKLAYLQGSHFMIYKNDGELMGGSVVLGLGPVFNQYEIDRQRLFSKILGQWFFNHRDLKPATLTEQAMKEALDQNLGINAVAQMPFSMNIVCPNEIQVFKIREP